MNPTDSSYFELDGAFAALILLSQMRWFGKLRKRPEKVHRKLFDSSLALFGERLRRLLIPEASVRSEVVSLYCRVGESQSWHMYLLSIDPAPEPEALVHTEHQQAKVHLNMTPSRTDWKRNAFFIIFELSFVKSG